MLPAELAAGLAERDAAVVSGGAYGIDGAAHRAALAADGFTVAVLAGGVDVSYPAGNAALFHRIAKEGLLVTEYPPGLRPQRHRFLTRNRLVAALSGATVVVEAGARSGAANTAAWARALGRGVCAVPGPVTSSASVGCHILLRAGATVVTRAEEVVELIGHAGELAPDEERPSSRLDGLAESETTCLRRASGPRCAHRRRDRGRVRFATDAGAGTVVDAGDRGLGRLPGWAVETGAPVSWPSVTGKVAGLRAGW